MMMKLTIHVSVETDDPATTTDYTIGTLERAELSLATLGVTLDDAKTLLVGIHTKLQYGVVHSIRPQWATSSFMCYVEAQVGIRWAVSTAESDSNGVIMSMLVYLDPIPRCTKQRRPDTIDSTRGGYTAVLMVVRRGLHEVGSRATRASDGQAHMPVRGLSVPRKWVWLRNRRHRIS
jgi:hypothetical protein